MNRPDDDANEEPPNGEEEHKDYTSSDEDKDETEEGEDYHPYTPFVREVKYAGGQQFPYQPMTIDESQRHAARFAMPGNLTPTVATIQELFLPHAFISKVARYSTLYGRTKRSTMP